jgi:predicted acetyltransferase
VATRRHVSWLIVTSPHDGLTFATIRPRELGADEVSERLDGWFEAQSRGFHQGRVSDELRKTFRQHLVADDATLRGVWQDRPVLGSSNLPVATYTSFDKTINVGGGRRLPVRMISDVTVSPTHRRRGLLRTLITDDLYDAAERGLPLAALTVSEGSIYGRFGFGLATQLRHVEVETTSRFALRGRDDEGHVELLEPEDAWPTVERIFGDFHVRTRGSIERPQFYQPLLTGTFNFEDGADRKLRAAVHLDPAGAPDGYVLYRPGDRKDGHRTIEVRDLVASTPSAYLRLWRFLADLDLSDRVSWHSAPVDDFLEWALVDPFAVKVVRVTDMLWVRVLDVVAALEARPWGADGTVVLEVADPLGHAAGRFRVTTAGGTAQVTRTEDEPTVLLDADTLGALYLGGVSVGLLRAAGRITGTEQAVDEWAAMADIGPAPYCITGF